MPEHKRDAPAFEGNARFAVLRSLGRGGMGAVYEVLDREPRVRLALKQLLHVAPEAILRFKAEFRTLRDLSHPNLVRLGELIEEGGSWFFTMELVEGSDLLGYVRLRTGGDEPVDLARSASLVTRVESASGDAAISVASGVLDAPIVVHASATRGSYDVDRVREALRQLAVGLDVIHRAGKVHRDVKPSNVRVTPEGRVVLLDFGVAADLRDGDVDDGTIVGTVSYMAPEQVRGGAVGPPADMYAVGTVLFEVLTGHVPFAGAASEVLARKLIVAVPAPSSFVDGVPQDLDALCVRMLALDPAARPTASELASALHQRVSQRPHTPGLQRAPFVGRQRELRALRAAYDDAREGRAVAGIVEGPSGVGKSATVLELLEILKREGNRPLVARARCHEKESVPYNAFDGIIDDLCRHLRRLEGTSADHGLPETTAALRQVFPVTRSVPVLEAHGDRISDAVAAPQILRRRAFEELHALLAAIAARRPLVLVIEDAHWADADSIALLDALTGLAPLAGVLFLATCRRAEREPRCPLASAPFSELRTITLEGLGEEDARSLVESILPQRAESVDVAAIVREAAGHPLFLDELARFAGATPVGSGGPLRLDDALAARAATLTPSARALLETSAVAGGLLPAATLSRAAGVRTEDLAAALAEVSQARLVRVARGRPNATIEPYHDRVREAVYGRLDATARKGRHRALAETLRAEGAAPEVLLVHFSRAGEMATAAAFAVRAATNAATSLAFDRAAELYRFALEHGASSDAERASLLAARSDALTSAGRPGAAAIAHLEAAEARGLSPEARLEQLRRAAEQYLTGGYYDEGLATAAAVLRAAGSDLPTNHARILAELVWNHVRLRVFPLTWTRRRDDELAPDVRTRLDITWSMGAGLTMVDPVRGALFYSRGPLECLRFGEELRIARSLAMAAMGPAAAGHRALAERLVEGAGRAADASGQPLAQYYASIARMGVMYFLDNDWRAVAASVAPARALWLASGRGVGWERDVLDQFACWTMSTAGELAALDARVDELLRETRGSGNRYHEVSLRSAFAYRHLFRGDVEALRRDVDEALAVWYPASKQFTSPHYWAIKSLAYAALYVGDPDASPLDAGWEQLDRSSLPRVHLVAIEAHYLRGGLDLARAARARSRGQGSASREHLARAADRARRIARHAVPCARSCALQLLAGIAHVEGDDARAATLLREVVADSMRSGAVGTAAAAELLLGRLLGGDVGGALVARASAWFGAEKVRDPDRLAGAVLGAWSTPRQ